MSTKTCTKCHKKKDESKFAGGHVCNKCKLASQGSHFSIKIDIQPNRLAEFFNHAPAPGNRLNLIQRSTILALHSLGIDVQSIVTMTGCTKTTVEMWIDRYKDTGSLEDMPRKGCNRITEMKDDDNIVQSVQEDPFTTPQIIRSSLRLEASARTVRRRLDEAGYFGRVARMEYPFTEYHVQRRIEFAEDYLDWSEDQWKNVIFSDEAYICLGSTGQVWVQRPEDTAWMQEYMVKGQDHFSPKIGIFGCFTHEGVAALRIFDFTMDKFKYRETLEGYLYPYVDENFGEEQCYYMHDNAPYAKANICLQSLEDHEVELIEMPPYSPDLNPTENLWAVLKRAIDKRGPRTMRQLTKIVAEEWSKIDSDFCAKLVASMPARMQAVLDADGHKTRH